MRLKSGEREREKFLLVSISSNHNFLPSLKIERAEEGGWMDEFDLKLTICSTLKLGIIGPFKNSYF